MPFLSPNQQCQCTESKSTFHTLAHPKLNCRSSNLVFYRIFIYTRVFSNTLAAENVSVFKESQMEEEDEETEDEDEDDEEDDESINGL